MDKYGNLTISLFDILDQQDDAKFIYFYLALDRPIKKIIENAFYVAYTKKLLDKDQPEIIHHNIQRVIRFFIRFHLQTHQ